MIMAKSNAGRKTKMTDAVVNKLEQAFLAGCTDTEACLYAGITRTTLHNYCTEENGFQNRKELLKDQPIMLSRFTILDKLKEGDIGTAKWVIDKKEGQKIKTDITSGGKPINTWTITPVTNEKE